MEEHLNLISNTESVCLTSPETDLKNLKDYKRMVIDYSLKGTIDKFRGKIRDKMKAYLLLLHLLDKRSLFR